MNMLRRRSSSGSRKPSTKVIFKKFIDFLQTDEWRLPTMNFLEKNSILFTREQSNHELCVAAHEQYTELVDTLIESYCADSNIATKDLVDALKLTDQSSKLSEKEKRLLESVVAAQDFNVFVPLMTRINIELQLQTVKMLEQICGVQAQSFKLSEDEMELWQSLFDEDETERYIIISVLKQSKEEFDRDEELRRALQEAFQASLNEIQQLEERRNREIAAFDSALVGTQQLAIDSDAPAAASDQPNPSATPISPSPPAEVPSTPQTPNPDGEKSPTKRKTSTTSKRPPPGPVRAPKRNSMQQSTSPVAPATPAAAAPAGFDFMNLLKDHPEMPEELIRQRAEYLKQQRDKLVAAKTAERERQLIEAAQKNAAARPRTAQAARAGMRGEGGAGRIGGANNADLLEARRAIANRIREQVMGAGERSDHK